MMKRAYFPEDWWYLDRPVVIAHRGASLMAPQNTLAAFRQALQCKADGVELDVHLTADGVPVVMHNPTVDETTDGRGYIDQMTLADIKRLDAGKIFGEAFVGEPVPTLREVLEAFGDRMLVNIELKAQRKGRGEALAAAVAQVVRETHTTSSVWVSSFQPYLLYAFSRVAPEIPRGLLYSPMSVALPWLVPFTPFEAIHPHVSLVSKWVVQVAHRLGLRVAVWTVDKPNLVRRVARLGVDVIITNDPAGALETLDHTQREKDYGALILR